MTILEEPRGIRTGRIWTNLDPLARQVVFDATEAHEGTGPRRMLAGFAGDLQADAYTGYDALYATGRIREIGLLGAYPPRLCRGAAHRRARGADGRAHPTAQSGRAGRG